MAYILRSNATVSDPDDKFPYYSRYGVTHKELATFMLDMESQGYVVTEGEFSALDDFITTLKSNLLWGKVHEVYPIIGNGLASSLVKLKTLEGGTIMSSLDGFNESHLEIVGGKVLGKKQTAATAAGSQPRVETGVTVASLLPGAGFHFYCGNAQAADASYMQPVIGALMHSSASGTSTQLAVDVTAAVDRSVFSASPINISAGYNNTPGIMGVVGRPNPTAVGVSTYTDYYRNGIFLHSQLPRLISGDASVTLSLFGRNAPLTTHGTGTSTGYSGIVRFGCITDGFWTAAQVEILHDALTQVVTDLGKMA